LAEIRQLLNWGLTKFVFEAIAAPRPQELRLTFPRIKIAVQQYAAFWPARAALSAGQFNEYSNNVYHINAALVPILGRGRFDGLVTTN